MNPRIFAAILVALSWGSSALAQDAGEKAKQLEALVAKGIQQGGALPEEDVRQALELGAALGRPHAVAPILKNYLSKNPNPPVPMLKLAADNALLAGDYRLAATRLKQYTQALPPGEEASRTAAALYRTLRDIGAFQDAYAYMTQYGEPLRTTVAARKYDRWYLDMAWEGGDVPAVARWLALCFGDKAPLEQERFLYWGDLDRLLEVTRMDRPSAYGALPHMRKLAGLIREDPVRAARLRFQAETMAFNAGAVGKDEAGLEAGFVAVAAAAKGWFDLAPTGDTLRSICEMWVNDFNRWPDHWQRARKGKEEFLKQAFGRLADADRAKVAGRCSRCLSPGAWLEFVKSAAPGPASSSWIGAVPFESNLKDPAAYRALVPKLAGVGGREAMLVRIMAAGEDLFSRLKYLADNESWDAGAVRDVQRLVDYDIVMLSRQLPGDTRKHMADEGPAQARYASEVLLASAAPIAMSIQELQAALNAAWFSGDRAAIPDVLRRLDWIPFSKDERAIIFGVLDSPARQWSEQVRSREADVKKWPDRKPAWDAEVALVQKIDQALKLSLDPNVSNTGKPPSPLAGHLAALRQAEGRRDAASAANAAREAYALVRDLDEKKLPYGRAIFRHLVRTRKDLNLSDFQCQALADQLARHAASGRSAYDEVFSGIRQGLGDLPGNDLRRANPADLARIEAAVAKATLDMLDAGKFNATVFDLYRQVRMDNDASRKIFAKLVEGKVLLQNPGYQPNPDAPRQTAAAKYQWLLASDFPWMNEKYPRDSYFDDMFAQEVSKTGMADPSFWRDSADKAHKGANAAAAVFKGFATLPFGYGGGKLVYTRDAYWEVVRNILIGADAGPRDEMVAAAEAAYGKTRFDDLAIGKARLDLINTRTVESRKAWFDGISALLDRAAKEPRMVGLPGFPGFMSAIAAANDITNEELSVLLRVLDSELLPGHYSKDSGDDLVALIDRSLAKHGRTTAWLTAARGIWLSSWNMDSSWRGAVFRPMTAVASTFCANKQYDLAATISLAGLTLRLDWDDRRQLETIRAKALASTGWVIPVDMTDARYDLYAGQMDYMSGLYREAWLKCLPKLNLVLPELQKLDPVFVVWLAGEAVRQKEYGMAEAIAEAMAAAVNAGTILLPDVESRARMDLVPADAALAQESYPAAKSAYEAVAARAEYATTRARTDAEVGVAEVLRCTEAYDEAAQRLEEYLRGNRDPYARARGNYELALVKFSDSAFEEAAKSITDALQADPNMADAKILQGKVNIAIKKLQEASRVEVSDLTVLQKLLVPGQPLTIQMEDRNLSVVQGNVAVEVLVQSESGDQVTISLLPFGDTKTLFRGEVGTALGLPNKADTVLQVLGGDKVRYDFSPRFKEANGIRDRGGELPVVTVRTDSELTATAGALRSAREDAEERILTLAARGGQKTRVSSGRGGEIKPGNTVQIRVTDPDQSTTTNRDTVVLTAKASSGDTVRRLVLTETDVASGVFEGSLRTDLAPAMASASDSTEGSDPVFAISGGKHPPWVALQDNKRPKTVTVDMNDNVALKSMNILADVPARGLKSFLVQTSMGDEAFRTVAAWPNALKATDGSLRMKVVSCESIQKLALGGGRRMVAAVNEFMAVDPAVLGRAQEMAGQLAGRRPHDRILDAAGVTGWYLVHLQGGFWVSDRKMRTFRPVVSGAAGSLLLVDGMPVERDLQTGKLELTMSFKKGVHTLDFYLWAQRNQMDVFYDIQWDIAAAPYFATCSTNDFDIVRNPQIREAMKFVPATVAARRGEEEFDVTFSEGMRARAIRLVMLDFKGDAPAIRKVTVKDVTDRRVLPTEMDLTELRRNDILETRPGDKITITYEDPTPITAAERFQKAELAVTYDNGKVGASFLVKTKDARGTPISKPVAVRRFRPGNTIYVDVSDADEDTTEKPDVVPVTVATSSGAKLELKATEGRMVEGGVDPQPRGGTFYTKFVPVSGEPKRPDEIKVEPGDDVRISYIDRENTDQGIPWPREVMIEQAGWGLPEARVYDFESAYLPEEDPTVDPKVREEAAAKEGKAGGAKAKGRALPAAGASQDALSAEFVPVRRVIVGWGRESTADANTATGMLTVPVLVDIIWPSMGLSSASEVHAYAQTYESRRLAGVTNDASFDPEMPGTLPLTFGPSAVGDKMTAPPGYESVIVRQRTSTNAVVVDRSEMELAVFGCAVRSQLGEPSTLTRDDRQARLEAQLEPGSEETAAAAGTPLDVLPVRGTNDGIVIAIPYNTDLVAYENGNLGTNWIVRRYTFRSDAFLDLMDLKYSRHVDSLFMGDKVYVRVIDPAGDVTGEKDQVNALVSVAGGEPVKLPLQETFPHTGVFKGVLEMSTIDEAAAAPRTGLVGASYGNKVTVSYVGGTSQEKLERTIRIAMGADGAVRGFTKVFKDPSVAVQTQLTMAESYFRLARNHFAAGRPEAGSQNLALGRKVLYEAITDYPESGVRAQMEYLLAELSLELGAVATDETEKKMLDNDALHRFSDLAMTYPDSEYAPKAQFQKANMLERLGQIDQACEEYVKLSYKYPEHPLVAETIARLGQYFLTKGKATKKEMESTPDPDMKKKLGRQYADLFNTGGDVFGRLSQRFPEHKLAAKTLVLGGQCYVQAGNNDAAIRSFLNVIHGNYGDKDQIAEAMYWCGDTYLKMARKAGIKKDEPSGYLVESFRQLKNLTWKYPESKWAKYARALLGDPDMLAVQASDNETQE